MLVPQGWWHASTNLDSPTVSFGDSFHGDDRLRAATTRLTLDLLLQLAPDTARRFGLGDDDEPDETDVTDEPDDEAVGRWLEALTEAAGGPDAGLDGPALDVGGLDTCHAFK